MIYALAATYRLRRVLQGGPVRGPDPALLTRFVTHSEEFYLAGRLVNVAFALASLALVYAVGRRAATGRAFFGLPPLCLRRGARARRGRGPGRGRGRARGGGAKSRYFMVVLVA